MCLFRTEMHSPAKKKKPESKTMIAYVQNLSPVKKSKKGKDFRYASLTLQTSDTESVEALLFSKHKRNQDKGLRMHPRQRKTCDK